MALDEYGRYQLQWMLDHGYGLDDLIDGLDQMGLDASVGVRGAYDAWEADRGFGGEIWACREEHCDDAPLIEHAPAFTIEGCTPDDVLERYSAGTSRQPLVTSRADAELVAREVNERLSAVDDLFTDVLDEVVRERFDERASDDPLASMPPLLMEGFLEALEAEEAGEPGYVYVPGNAPLSECVGGSAAQPASADGLERAGIR